MLISRAAVIAVLAASRLAMGEPDPAAKAKLQASADALKALKGLQYKVVNRGEGGMLALFSPKCDTTVVMERLPGNDKVWQIRVEGKAVMKMPGQPEQATPYMLVGDGTSKAWKEEQQKQVIQRPNNLATGGSVEIANKAAASEILENDAFAKELSWPNITVEAPGEVDGTMCDVVWANDGTPNGLDRPHRFFLAQSDHLPRRIEHWLKGGNMNDAEVWVVSEIKVNQPAPVGSFTIVTPEGWQFIPATPPPAAATPSAPTTTSNGVTTTTPARQRPVGVNEQDTAPDFELSSGTGEKVRLSSMRDSVVLLDFWGTWCVPCKEASPEIQKLVNDYKTKPVKAYGLAVRETSDEKPINYMKEGPYTYGLLLKADEVAKTYHVKAYPTYFVIGKSGEVVYSAAGYDEKTFPAIRRAVDAALEGKPMPKELAKPAEESKGDAAPAKADPKVAKPPSKVEPVKPKGG
jgi:thiol-disulfide isomerase/thioredoxin